MTSKNDIRIQSLEAEVQALQRALAFWIPSVPTNWREDARHARLSRDIDLLAGYLGPTEKDAEQLGWIEFKRA